VCHNNNEFDHFLINLHKKSLGLSLNGEDPDPKLIISVADQDPFDQIITDPSVSGSGTLD